MSGGGHGGLFTVHGLGGHISVFADRIEIHRHGLFHMLLEILNLYEGSTDLVLPLAKITSVSIIDPWLEPGYIRFTYAGSPAYTKHYWVDAMAPNTLLMGYFDTRGFHRLRDFIIALHSDEAHGEEAHSESHAPTQPPAAHPPTHHPVATGEDEAKVEARQADAHVGAWLEDRIVRQSQEPVDRYDVADRYRVGGASRYVSGWHPDE